MADSFVINLDSRNESDLWVSGFNKGDERLYMHIVPSGTSSVVLLPGESLNALIVPRSAGMSDAAASGLLVSSTLEDSPTDGIYTMKLQNDTTEVKVYQDLLKEIVMLNYDYENVQYDLHWVQLINNESGIYSNYTGIYSYPHNLQGSEVYLAMQPLSGYVRYTLAFPAVNNSADSLYTGTHQPYQLGFYFYNPKSGDVLSGLINSADVEFADGVVSGYAPSINTGVLIDIPLYDPRETNQIPGNYEIYVGYLGAGGAETSLLAIHSPHESFLNDIIPDLRSSITTTYDPNKLRKVGEEPIRKNVIDRRRLSIGIKDISTDQNVYSKQGTYVSPYFISDNGIYTFSLKVREEIPNYVDVDPYSTVRYFVQFNNLNWEPISPTTRNQEFDITGNTIPKLLVFDVGATTDTSTVKYLKYTANIASFRIKIDFDITQVGPGIPPEVKDYRCVIFDKAQLLEL